MSKIFYEVDHDRFKYPNPEAETETDKLLTHFSNLAMMWQKGVLHIKDMQPVVYYVLRIAKNKGMQKYFKRLTKGISKLDIPSHPFLSLDDLAKKLHKRSMRYRTFKAWLRRWLALFSYRLGRAVK